MVGYSGRVASDVTDTAGGKSQGRMQRFPSNLPKVDFLEVKLGYGNDLGAIGWAVMSGVNSSKCF